jgi:F-type H+-transporting ATPase subunit delta
MSLVADRYAKALLDLAISENAVDEYQNELIAVSEVFETEKDFTAFLHSPQKDLPAKKSLIIHVFKEQVTKNIFNLLLLLLDKKRIESLQDICSAYVKMADEHQNILNITVTAALPLTKEQIDSISEKFMAIYHGSSVKITVKTDNSLIGGIKVTLGDKLYDGTVKGQLSKMQSAVAGQ